MNVISYPIGEAARQYAEEVKPVLAQVAKKLGYAVGRYSGHGHPCTVLRRVDPASPVDCVVLYWHGCRLEAGLRSRQWRREMSSPLGQIAHAFSWGVHEAYGDSVAPDLATRIEQAVSIATDVFHRSLKP